MFATVYAAYAYQIFASSAEGHSIVSNVERCEGISAIQSNFLILFEGDHLRVYG